MAVLRDSRCGLLWEGLCLLLAMLYIGVIVCDYWAGRSASSQKLSDIQRAAVLNPGNADVWDRAGFYMTFAEQRGDLALPLYRKAATLDPYAADYWLDLAAAYALASKGQDEAWALNHALQAAPKTPTIARDVASAYLARGEFQQAFLIFRTILLDDPSQADSIVETCWRATENIDSMNALLPPTPVAYLAFIKILIADGEVEALDKLWSRMLTLQGNFDPELAMPYIEYLIAQHRMGEAMAAWNDLAGATPSFRAYRSDLGNLVVNGGFEAKVLDRGFDWRYESRPGVTLAVDAEQFRGGNHSLLAVFDGQPVGDTGLSQTVAVEANASYEFRAYAKSENVLTARGPQFVVDDAIDGKKALLLAGDLSGTYDWKLISGAFETGPATRAVSVRLAVPSGASRVIGRLWIDDVSIRRN